MVALAPFGAIPDGVEMTVITDKKILEKSLPIISSFISKMGRWMKNPLMRWMIKRNAGIESFNTIEKHLLDRILIGHYDISKGQEHIMRGAPAIIIFHANKGTEEHTADSLIYVTYAALAAHSLGLGATINGLIAPFINQSAELKDIFQIPGDNEAIICLLIGYPVYKYKYGIKRDKNKVHWL
jgi:hypothetical protein